MRGRSYFNSWSSTMISSPDSVAVLLDRMAIVMAGSFNPSIFHTSWFAKNGILRDVEADGADVLMVNPQLAHFRAEWLEVQVTRERFLALSRNGGYEEPLRDLVVSTFTLLSHTPVKALGINREVQVRFDTVERWHKFGHLLVPKDIWKGVLDEPGLSGLQIQGRRAQKGAVLNVYVTNTGERRADIDINDHRPAGDGETAGSLTKLLRASWDESQAEGGRVVEHLLNLIR